ncbi:hypothetical protein SmJEL517_g02152 [Synchytrium microbalum]|uniref:RNA cytidine acetyltransferase n=1 Tax=Synchytrium microbalum TaxID=1806994 RepID=A0A507C8K8_9FUNG|nr:uncharacterized protein SmJEL517_g02152 [Synchytrium microbalum]TPX35479.1 hypothetical protein SmJEL517_g02152 [Synchytrium microbalum]
MPGETAAAAPTGQQRKKLDSRIPALISNGVNLGNRSLFVLVGDKGKDQVVTLHFLLSKVRVAARPSVLWCYKKELGFSSHRKKRMRQIKKQVQRGQKSSEQDDPFELFISSTNIRYTYYKESEKILGQTFGMCVLQDFEALTPNLLARTIETVEGGGIVVLLLRTMSSLKQLYTMTMDVHSRYRTESHTETVARFNERFILSMGGCDACLVLDDELNVLPLSAGKDVKLLPPKPETTSVELKELKAQLSDSPHVGALINCAKTVDQAKAVLIFVEAIAEKTLRSTVALTAARGRGKSAALGLSIAAAVAHGYSNIFITSPTPENLKTVFEFIFKGFDALGFEEHLDYDIIQSTNPDFQKAVVRVNVFRDHRQTIQYIQPQDSQFLSQAELVVIDEAAAIPLPLVQKLLGPYLVFISSTINGYEGTGRSLSLKLIQGLREQSRGFAASGARHDDRKEGVLVDRQGHQRSTGDGSAAPQAVEGLGKSTGRVLREIKLEEPIRYAPQDPVESWLNKLLCLDCCNPSNDSASSTVGSPHPSACELFYVNRDTLFSYHPASEQFLQKMMALYVASHYKNSPNDLQLLSDAPAHHLFVLLPPLPANPTTLPEPLVVIQVCFEGSINRASVMAALSKGLRRDGDLIPWLVSQQFQDDGFAMLSGARVVRIATHPDFASMGYGTRALELLERYYKGDFVGLNENENTVSEEFQRVTDAELLSASLATDDIRIRDASSMPPLLLRLSERPPKEQLDWLGVSYGLTADLHRYWKRGGYRPVYIRQTANDLTGEHTCVMLKSLREDSDWLMEFTADFRRRFLELLGYQLRKFSPLLVLSVLEATGGGRGQTATSGEKPVNLRNPKVLKQHYRPFDLKRLDAYSSNLLDYHVIVDLVPSIARQYFMGIFDPIVESTDETAAVRLSPVQAAILIGVGLQRKTLDDLNSEMGLPISQIMALFGKILKKTTTFLQAIVTKGVEGDIGRELLNAKMDIDGGDDVAVEDDEDGKKRKRDVQDEEAWDPTATTLEDDLEEAGKDALEGVKEQQRELINSLDLTKYVIAGTDDDWKKIKPSSSTKVVSIPNPHSSKKKKQQEGLVAELEKKNDAEMIDPMGHLSKKKGKKAKSGL